MLLRDHQLRSARATNTQDLAHIFIEIDLEEGLNNEFVDNERLTFGEWLMLSLFIQ
jgi:hypothetical protein